MSKWTSENLEWMWIIKHNNALLTYFNEQHYVITNGRKKSILAALHQAVFKILFVGFKIQHALKFFNDALQVLGP